MTLGKLLRQPIIEGIVLYLTPVRPTLSIAQLNLWNFFDTVDNPRTNDTVVPKAEFVTRLHKLALTITTTLNTPDIISLNEVENQGVIDALLALPSLKGYRGVVRDSNDGRGINVGVLYREGLEVTGVDMPNPKMSFKTDSAKGQIDPSLLYARAPLVVDFKLTGARQALAGVKELTVIVNHFKSKLGGDGPEPRRQMQGQYLGEYIDGLKAAKPNKSVVVIGDLNANYEDGAYKKLAHRADGTERLKDVGLTLPAEDRYTYIYRGKKNSLDHIMVTGDLFAQLKSVSIPHINTVRGAAQHKLDPTTSAGISDHDPMLAILYT